MTIEKIKNTINDNLGCDIIVTYNEGRNKIYVYKGKVMEVYNNIFIVFDNDYFCKRCFSYYDVLIKNVKISFH